MAFLIVFFLHIIASVNTVSSIRGGNLVYLEKQVGQITETDKQDIILEKLNQLENKLDEKDKWWEKALFAFCVPLLVAVMAYLGIIQQSKAATISKFRIDWVDQLRTNYSEFFVSLHLVGNKVRARQLSMNNYTSDPDAEKMLLMRTKIKLMLTHSQQTHMEHVEFWRRLIDYSNENEKYYASGVISKPEEDRIDQIRIDMEDILLDIFQKEWQQAKKFK